MVSIIVPVYQVSNYVERCIRSVMAQTYTDIECIIVDDATTDDSIEKCERLIREYDMIENLNNGGRIRFKVLHHEVNRGLSAARNTGTKVAEGEYLYYLDSDDSITPDCIEKLVSIINDDPTIEMVQGNSLMKSGDANTQLYGLGHSISISNNDEARREFFKNRNIYISVWNRLLKKSFVEGYALYCREGLVFEDLLWVFYLMKHLRKAYLYEGITHYYCLRQGSILVEAKPKAVMCYVTSFNEILNNLSEGFERDEIEGFVYYFIKRYVAYVKIVPEFKESISLYMSRAKQFHCWYVYIILIVIFYFGRFGNPSKVLEWLNTVRWIMKKYSKSE